MIGACAGKYSWPRRPQVSSQAKDFVAQLLRVDVDERIGMGDIQARCTLRAYDAVTCAFHCRSHSSISTVQPR